MIKRVLILVLVMGFLGNLNAQVDDKKAREILDAVSAKAKTYTNMKFEFTYSMVDKANKINESLDGTIVLQGQKFNLDFMGRKIISDGKTVWTYSEDDEEVQISSVNPDEEAFNPGTLLTAYDKSYRSKLIKTVKENGKDVHIIDLYPKEGKSYFKIRMKIDKASKSIVSGTVFSKDNVTYAYTVNKFTPNVKVAADFFKFDMKKYPDVEVIDLR